MTETAGCECWNKIVAFVEIIPLERCRKGAGTFVQHGDRGLAVFRLAGPGRTPVPAERVVIIDNACPHAGGNLSGGEVVGNEVTCRWHHWTFDLRTGRCTDSPRARACVRRYPAEIRSGIVWADLDAPPGDGI